MKRTAIYMRVSTDRQARDGQSLGFQRSLLLDYIKTHPDLVLVGEYMDDGISGTKFDQRDELQRMLRDVENGKIDLILFTKLDRFFRSVRHLMNTLDTLEKHNVEWNAIQENFENQSPTGKLSLTIFGAFAELEASMDSQRTKDAFVHKRSKREWLNGNTPFGYKIVDKHAVPDPKEAELVRKIYADYIKCGNLHRVHENFIMTVMPKSRKSIKRILTNRAYIGEMHGIENYMEPIVDRKTFDTVQKMLTINVKKTAHRVYIFTGLIICPECKCKYSGFSGNGFPRYRCNRHLEHRCNNALTISEKKLESFLIENYRDDLEKRYLKLKETKKVDNTQKINALYRKIERLKELYINELIGLDEYKEDLEKYRQEINTLSVPQETNTKRIEKLLEMNVYEIYWTLTNEQKRRLWRSVINSITPKDGTFFVDYV